MDIIQILHEIAENEDEKYKSFKQRLVEYCNGKKTAVYSILRVLKGIEVELSECLDGRIHINVERAIVIKVLKTIRIEIEIVRFKMRNPRLFTQGLSLPVEPIGIWTANKDDLVELIYAIKMSVNNGNVSSKTLQECFEYIFQVKLGNLEKKFKELDKKYGTKVQQRKILVMNLSHFQDEIENSTIQHKLKWTGSIVEWVELVYALHSVGYADGGQASLKKLFAYLGEVFDIEVKEFSRTFIDVKNRVKGDRTSFLDELKRVLIERIEKADEKPSRK